MLKEHCEVKFYLSSHIFFCLSSANHFFVDIVQQSDEIGGNLLLVHFKTASVVFKNNFVKYQGEQLPLLA